MKHSVLAAALLAIALSACAKKEEAPVALPAPAIAPSLAAQPPATPPASIEAGKPAGEEKPAQ